MSGAGWEQQDQLEAERRQRAVEALQRCLENGAKKEDIEHLARECGVKPEELNV